MTGGLTLDPAARKYPRTGIKRIKLSLWLILVGIALVGASQAFPQNTPSIRVTNHESGSTVRYPVVLLKGVIENVAERSITVINNSSRRNARQMEGQIYKGRFKAICELVPGVNQLTLKAGATEMALVLRYQPQTNPYVVRIIYMTDSGGDTTYESPYANDPQDYAAKLDTAMKLLQTMTAERMYDLGFGHITFNLELDPDGKVRVHTFKGALPAADYYRLNEQGWYRHVANELEGPFPTDKAKNVVLAAYTRMDPKTKKLLAHTALGEGGLALFGGASLFTWPSRLADVQKAFTDSRTIDANRYYTSSFRSSDGNTMWGTASATLGATLHELGHTFGLMHTLAPSDIMNVDRSVARGFDLFNRVFTLFEPGPDGAPREFSDEHVACFPPISAIPLRLSPWFSLDKRPDLDSAATTIHLDGAAGRLLASSSLGIGYLGASQGGDMRFYAAPALDGKPPAIFSVNLSEVKEKLKPGDFVIHAIDAAGRWKNIGNALLSLDFAGHWTGRWKNDRGEEGEDSLKLSEASGDGVTGTWTGAITVYGERVGKDAFVFKAKDGNRHYLVLGRIVGQQLLLDYTVQQDKKRYYGWSVLQRTGKVAEIKRDSPTQFTGKWKGTFENSAGTGGQDTIDLALAAGGVLSGHWSGIQVSGQVTGAATFFLEAKNGDRVYKAIGRVERDLMTIDYSVSQGGRGSYYGLARLKR